jgi:uncharacterized protein YabE (DUF348 family)
VSFSASTQVTTERDDVATLLDEQGVAVRDGDLVSPAQDAPLEDGSVIVVRHVVPVTLQVGG